MEYIFVLLFFVAIISLGIGILKPSLVIKWKDKPDRMDVLKTYIGLAVVSLVLVGVFAPAIDTEASLDKGIKEIEKVDKEVPIGTNTKEAEQDISVVDKKSVETKDITLKIYKQFRENERHKYLKEVLIYEKIDLNQLDNYINCMGDFAYSKNEDLSFKEVLMWCKNENKRAFLSHINELYLREEGNYKISYDENIEKIKKDKLDLATEKSIKEEEHTLKGVKPSPTRYDKPIEALNAFGGLYDIVEVSKDTLILYTPFYKNYGNEIIMEDIKRNFIYGIYISLIHTNYESITIKVIPQESNTKEELKELTIRGKIRRKDAIQVAEKLLKINKLDDLLGEDIGDYFSKDSPNKIFKRALYNDMGRPTLNVFFEELSNVTR